MSMDDFFRVLGGWSAKRKLSELSTGGESSQLAITRDSLIHQFGRVLPTPRLPMLAENFEDQVEELHYRYPDRDIDRNLQPATRL
jgi:hypothetical protein